MRRFFRKHVTFFAFLSLLVVFLLDVSVPREYNVSLLYFLPLLFSISSSAPPPSRMLYSVILCLFLDSAMDRPSLIPFSVFIFNRIFIALFLGMTAFLLSWQRRMNERLRRSEALQRSISAATPVGLGVVVERRFTWVNEELERLTGYSFAELKGQSSRILYHGEEEFERVGRLKYADISRKGKGVIETRWRHKDGRLLHIMLSSAPIDQRDLRRGVVFSAMDITRLKDAETELGRRKQTFEALAEHSPDVICLYDSEGRMRYVNSTITRYTGRGPGYYIGRKIQDLDVPGEIKAIWQEMFDVAFKRGISVSKEMDFHALNDRRIFVNTYFPVLSPSTGKPEAVINFAHDVTEFKLIQRMLEKRASEAEEGRRTLEALLMNIPVGVLIVDRKGMIRQISAYFLRRFGMSREKTVGTQFRSFVERLQLSYSDGTRVTYEKLALVRAMREVLSTTGLELRLRLPDGRLLPVLVNATPIKDRNGRVTAGIVVWNDISKLKSAEEVLRRDRETFERLVLERTRELISAQLELEQARRLSDIGSLAATVAHELRNPLGVIKASSFNIKRRAGRAPITMQLNNIEKKISQADQIINNLLFYARLKKPQFERIDLYAVLQESIDSCRKRYSDIFIEDDLDRVKELEMDADSLQMTELFNNIISNACDAVRSRHGRIRISGDTLDGSVRLIFDDNGEGMDPGQLKKIFEPFYTTKAKGTGLGLSVVRQIVSLHHGSIDVKSEKGKGTVFSVTLPVSHAVLHSAGS